MDLNHFVECLGGNQSVLNHINAICDSLDCISVDSTAWTYYRPFGICRSDNILTQRGQFSIFDCSKLLKQVSSWKSFANSWYNKKYDSIYICIWSSKCLFKKENNIEKYVYVCYDLEKKTLVPIVVDKETDLVSKYSDEFVSRFSMIYYVQASTKIILYSFLSICLAAVLFFIVNGCILSKKPIDEPKPRDMVSEYEQLMSNEDNK